MHGEFSKVRSTLPPRFEDPDLYPEQLKDAVSNVQQQIRQANDALAKARWHLNVAEESFARAESSFLTEEIRQVERVQRDLKTVWAALGKFRGFGARELQEPVFEPIPDESVVEETPLEESDIEYDDEV